jgi:hypothetical protein
MKQTTTATEQGKMTDLVQIEATRHSCVFCRKIVDVAAAVPVAKDDTGEWVETDTPTKRTAIEGAEFALVDGQFVCTKPPVRIWMVDVAGPTCAKKHLNREAS